MMKEIIIPDGVFESRNSLEYSQAIKVGNTIYLSGSMPCDENFNLIALVILWRKPNKLWKI